MIQEKTNNKKLHDTILKQLNSAQCVTAFTSHLLAAKQTD